MNPIIDQLFKIEQVAKNMKSDVDDQKEKLRLMYRKKQLDFDQESDRETKEQLKQFHNESRQLQDEKNKMIYDQYNTELDLLENVYKTKQDQIVTKIFTNIIKG